MAVASGTARARAAGCARAAWMRLHVVGWAHPPATRIRGGGTAVGTAAPRAHLCWVSSIFGLGLAWEVMGCAADDFPVRDGLKVGLHLSCMAKSEKSRHDKAQLGFAHGPLGGWGAPHAERA